jgi:hypothetical protein
VINQAGSVVLSRTLTATKGNNTRKLDLGNLPNGLYFIKIQTGAVIQTTKLVIGK